jgi:arginyl-tRNA synthetase
MYDVVSSLEKIVKDTFGIVVDIAITVPVFEFGDCTTNCALQLSRQLKKSPREIAEKIVSVLEDEKLTWFASAKVEGPGFINIVFKDNFLFSFVEVSTMNYEKGNEYVLEYSCPNAFKELHAGHLYQTIAGDSIARLLEHLGAKVHRTNFGGDVGLHVAKAMWGIVNTFSGEDPLQLSKIDDNDRPKFLSKSYVMGAAAYENDAIAQTEIDVLNKRIYELHNNNDRESGFAKIYWTCRQWSYDYFNKFYSYLGAEPFRFYAESETAPVGLDLVEKGLREKIFVESQGAIVFVGENEGLHTRVFVTKAGLPTYETKDLGVINKEFEDYYFTKRILITGRDQAEYMKVVFAAAEKIMPETKNKMLHLTNGIIKFANGAKMSSRLGNVTTANEVIETVYSLTPEASAEATRKSLALGAVKYSLLKQRLGGDVAFDVENSVSLMGNSGPYLQYALVRAYSILEKAQYDKTKSIDFDYLETAERRLIHQLAKFNDVCKSAAQTYSPHILCTFLYETASAFNVFYEHNRVIGVERSEIRLKIVHRYSQILEKGLELLGIDRIQKM